MKKNPLLAGALLLTAAGFASRILGFFYRIFLSRSIGAEGIGLCQMVLPIHGIAFALCCGPVQTALSRLIAAHPEKGRACLRTGLLISLSLSLPLVLLICAFAPVIASRLLLEEKCAPLLPVLALSIPLSAVHACLCGCFFGLRKTAVPALSQLTEQLVRIGTCLLLARIAASEGRVLTARLALSALLAGEAASVCTCLLFFSLPADRIREPLSRTLLPFLSSFFPLMGNRLILNLLKSLEAVFVPQQLTLFGLSSARALELYGTLTGMALPFLLFPSAVTGSLAVLLLPSVSEAQAKKQQDKINRTVRTAAAFSLSLGILSAAVFSLWGGALGVTVFHSREAGLFLRTLAWICPFLSLSATMGSILNGLGKTGTVFFHTALSLLAVLASVVFAVPHLGINAYLAALLCGELLLSLLHLHAVIRVQKISLPLHRLLRKPLYALSVSGGLLLLLEPLFGAAAAVLSSAFLLICLKAGILTLFYFGILYFIR